MSKKRDQRRAAQRKAEREQERKQKRSLRKLFTVWQNTARIYNDLIGDLFVRMGTCFESAAKAFSDLGNALRKINNAGCDKK